MKCGFVRLILWFVSPFFWFFSVFFINILYMQPPTSNHFMSPATIWSMEQGRERDEKVDKLGDAQ